MSRDDDTLSGVHLIGLNHTFRIFEVYTGDDSSKTQFIKSTRQKRRSACGGYIEVVTSLQTVDLTLYAHIWINVGSFLLADTDAPLMESNNNRLVIVKTDSTSSLRPPIILHSDGEVLIDTPPENDTSGEDLVLSGWSHWDREWVRHEGEFKRFRETGSQI